MDEQSIESVLQEELAAVQGYLEKLPEEVRRMEALRPPEQNAEAAADELKLARQRLTALRACRAELLEPLAVPATWEVVEAQLEASWNTIGELWAEIHQQRLGLHDRESAHDQSGRIEQAASARLLHQAELVRRLQQRRRQLLHAAVAELQTWDEHRVRAELARRETEALRHLPTRWVALFSVWHRTIPDPYEAAEEFLELFIANIRIRLDDLTTNKTGHRA